MVLVKSLMIRGSTDFGKAKADLEDVAVRARKVGEISPTIDLKVDDGAALLKLKAFSMELRALKDSGSQAGLSDLAARLKSFGNEAGTSRTKMAALKLETDALKASMGGAGGGRGGLAGAAGEAESGLAGMAGPSGMGAAITAGVALAPLAVTVGTGLAGIGAAAYGVISPIEKAAGKVGGLKANMGTLDAEQKTVAKSILGLGKEYGVFQKSLEPQVVGAFGQAIKIAGNLMRDVEPVAKATGTAFSQFLGQFGNTLQDPQWRQFWSFMARTAPGDMRLLGDTLTSLTNDLPGLLEGLQPAGTAILTIGDDAAKAIGPLERFVNDIENSPLGTRQQMAGTRSLDAWTVHMTNMIPGAKAVNDWLTRMQHDLTGTGGAAAKAGVAMGGTAAQAHAMGTRLLGAQTSVTALMTAEKTSLTTLNTYAGDLVTTASDAASLKAALKASHDQIGLHTAAQRASFGAANTFITDLGNQATAAYASGRGVDASIKAIKDGLPILENAKTKNRAYWEEVKALVAWLEKLRAQRNITEVIRVTGTGHWAATSGELPGQPGMHFAGKFAGGTPGAKPGWAWVGEQGPELVHMRGGEQVLSHTQSARVTGGYAAGTYQGSLAGLRPWAATDNRAAERSAAAWVAMAETAQMAQRFAHAFRAATGGALGGDPAANRALARRMFPWPAYMWPDFDLLEMREAGFNRFARNPSSGAYGIPQALPPTKMPFAAQAAGGSHAGAQIAWMYGYEHGRYGDPLRAWGHEMTYGWYDRGGWLPPGASIAVNNTGRPERVGGGNTYNITVHPSPLARPADIGREVVACLKAFEKGSGASWRK